MAYLFIVRICVMALCKDTTTVEAGKADVYSFRVILVIITLGVFFMVN